jgi:hypothetical protein
MTNRGYVRVKHFPGSTRRDEHSASNMINGTGCSS